MAEADSDEGAIRVRDLPDKRLRRAAPIAIATAMPITDTSDKPGCFASIRTPSMKSSAEPKLVEPHESARRPRVDPVALNVSEFHPGLPSRLLGRHSAAHKICRPQIEVMAKFLRHLRLDRVTVAQPAP